MRLPSPWSRPARWVPAREYPYGLTRMSSSAKASQELAVSAYFRVLLLHSAGRMGAEGLTSLAKFFQCVLQQLSCRPQLC